MEWPRKWKIFSGISASCPTFPKDRQFFTKSAEVTPTEYRKDEDGREDINEVLRHGLSVSVDGDSEEEVVSFLQALATMYEGGVQELVGRVTDLRVGILVFMAERDLARKNLRETLESRASEIVAAEIQRDLAIRAAALETGIAAYGLAEAHAAIDQGREVDADFIRAQARELVDRLTEAGKLPPEPKA